MAYQQYPVIVRKMDTDEWDRIEFPPIHVRSVELFQACFNQALNEMNTYNGTWIRENNPLVTAILVANDTSKQKFTVLLGDDEDKYSHKELKTFDKNSNFDGYQGKTIATLNKSKNYLVYKKNTNTSGILLDCQDDIMFTF